MEKIAWLIDSASDVKEEMKESADIFVMPLHVIIDGQSYRDGLDITPEEVFERMKTSEEMKTSQPSVGEFVEVYEKIKQQNYDRCIAIHVSSGLSGTYNSSHIAAGMVDLTVEIIDSEMASIPMIFILEEGLRLQKEGRSFEEIVQALREVPSRIRAYVLVNELDRLRKGGRLNSAQFLMGNLLQVKPILHFVDKTVVSFEKVRGFNKAKRRILDLFGEDASAGIVHNAYIVHSDYEEAIQWKNEIMERFPNISVELSALGPTIGVHTGTGTVALTWLIK